MRFLHTVGVLAVLGRVPGPAAGQAVRSGDAAPAAAGTEWPRLSFAAAGMDSVRLAELLDRIRDHRSPGIDGLVIVRHGGLVLEAYFNGYEATRPHDLRSATKSVTSLLVGAAVDRGALSLDDPVVRWFPEYRPAAGWDETRAALRLRDLLTMRTGLACDDFDPDSPGNEERMYPEDDWTRFFFRIPAAQESPGTRFSYCTAGATLLGEILARATRLPVSRFADEVLWHPLAVPAVRWRATPTGGAMTGGNLWLTPRDMARLGQLVLDRGRANGRQVVPEWWVEASCAPQVDEPDRGYRYGLLWWIRNPITDSTTLTSCHASGNGGQKIFVVPGADLVVVFTGSNYDNARLGHRQPVILLNQFILPAVIHPGSAVHPS